MNNKQRVGIDANLGIVGIIEAVAFFAHDASIGINQSLWI